MNIIVKSRSAVLGTNKQGEIVFNSISNGVKPLVFDSAESAWNTLKYALEGRDIRCDEETDRAYEILGPNKIVFLAGLTIIKDLVYQEIIETEKQCDVCALRKMIGDNL